MKVYWLFNHPAPYKVELFNLLGKEIDLTVVFERASEGDRTKAFYDRSIVNFEAHICKSLKLGVMNNYTAEPVKILKQNQYDIVVLNGWRMMGERKAISYCKKHGIPYVFAINGGVIRAKENLLLRRIKRKYISGANAYICPDEKSKEYLIYYGADKDKISLFPYSTVHESELLLEPYSLTQKRLLRDKYRLVGEKMFVSSGQLIERKNYSQLIRIWKDMPSNYTLAIAGDGPLRQQLQKQIDEEGLQNVYLLGYMPHDEMLKFFRAFDAFVLLSGEDIYGHVINEALSQGIPVIAPPTMNAACHLIEEGKNGFLVSLEDEEQIKEALLTPFDEAMGMAAIETARENTLEKTAAWHLDFFQQYLGGQK